VAARSRPWPTCRRCATASSSSGSIRRRSASRPAITLHGKLGQAFWRRLIRATILPTGTPIETADDALVAKGHGLTDLLKLPTPRDEASDAQLRAGVGPLWQKVAIWRPGAVVFIYKRAAEIVAARPLAEPWGQLPGVALSGRPCFLMPGPYAPVAEVDAGLNFLRNLAASLPR